MDEPKFCKDCKHFSRAWPSTYSRCGVVRDPVTGKPGAYADIERQYGSAGCGPSGARFEPKRGLFASIFFRHQQR